MKQAEDDGLQLMDLQAEDFEDLRMSIGPEQKSILDQVTYERDQLKLKIDAMQRDHLNQTFEMNLNMKEEIESVREEILIKNDQLGGIERKLDQSQCELQFYKVQNQDLIAKMDEFEVNQSLIKPNS